jgi:hypothetical protein
LLRAGNRISEKIMRKQNVRSGFHIDRNGQLKRPVLRQRRKITPYKLVMADRYSSATLRQALTKYEFTPARFNGGNAAR